MSNVTQDVLLQAFNQGLGTHASIDNHYAAPVNIVNRYTPFQSKPMTFKNFTPMQKSIMMKTRGVIMPSMPVSSDMGGMPQLRTTPQNGFGVL